MIERLLIDHGLFLRLGRRAPRAWALRFGPCTMGHRRPERVGRSIPSMTVPGGAQY